MQANVHPNPEEDKNNLLDPKKFTIQTYTDKSPEDEMPDFLIDPNFFFKLYNLKEEHNDDIENISSSELKENELDDK